MSVTKFDPLSYQHLGFDDVRQWLADEAAGDSIRQRFQELEPGETLPELNLQFSRIAEIQALMDLSNGFQIRYYDDLYEVLRLLALEGQYSLSRWPDCYPEYP